MAKICFKCKERKRASEFYKHKKMADGTLNKCKDCTRKDVLKNRRENIERYRETDRERGKLPHRKLKVREYSKTINGKKAIARARLRYQANHKQKRVAHVLVNNAIRNGSLTKKACAICGKKKAEAHHDDYTKPLKVRWLCIKHHNEFHEKERSNKY